MFERITFSLKTLIDDCAIFDNVIVNIHAYFVNQNFDIFNVDVFIFSSKR